MAAYGVYTKLGPEQAIEKAEEFFGEELGLGMTRENPCCVTFVGGVGHVTATARPEGKRTVVDIQAREWDVQAKQFVRRIT